MVPSYILNTVDVEGLGVRLELHPEVCLQFTGFAVSEDGNTSRSVVLSRAMVGSLVDALSSWLDQGEEDRDKVCTELYAILCNKKALGSHYIVSEDGTDLSWNKDGRSYYLDFKDDSYYASVSGRGINHKYIRSCDYRDVEGFYSFWEALIKED